MTTYTIRQGGQYKGDAAYVTDGRSGRSSYDAAGQHLSGNIGNLDFEAAELKLALLRVIKTGQEEIITIGKPAPKAPVAEIPGLCSRCGTVCYGDCEAA